MGSKNTQILLNRRKRGAEGEALAARFLEQMGFNVLQRNYRYERGEVDIIAEDGEELVFVEVKARRSKSYGEPEESVTPKKQQQIRTVAEGYLFEHGIEGRACRFDVVGIFYRHGKPEINHLKNAF